MSRCAAWILSSARSHKDDIILHCTDGLYGFGPDEEILEVVSHHEPAEACERCWHWLKNGKVRTTFPSRSYSIEEVHRAIFFSRSHTGYLKNKTVETKEEYSAGAVLDNRFEITECVAAAAWRASSRPATGRPART